MNFEMVTIVNYVMQKIWLEKLLLKFARKEHQPFRIVMLRRLLAGVIVLLEVKESLQMIPPRKHKKVSFLFIFFFCSWCFILNNCIILSS